MTFANWSDGVSVVGTSPHRKVVAKRQLRRGEIILQELPTLSILGVKQWGERCNLCFARPTTDTSDKLLRCSRCRTFYYCSKQCQRTDWKFHKHECTALSQNPHATRTPEINSILADALLVTRLFRLKQSEPSQFQAVQDLVFHKKCIQKTHYEIAKLVQAWGLLQPTQTKDDTEQQLSPALSKVVEILARFDANNFGVVDDLLFLLGAGIYPAGAMLNHSCHANCAIRYAAKTRQQIILCIADVQEGEELCHSYIDLACTCHQRRDKLRKTYGFECQCCRCQDADGRWSQSDSLLTALVNDTDPAVAEQIIAESEMLLQQAAITDDISQELHLVQQCVNARSKMLHPRHIALYQARSQLHTTAMAAGELKLARDQCVEIVLTMQQCFYRPEHPLTGVMLYTLGSLYHSLNSLEDAVTCYEKALPILEAYHGKDSAFTSGCREYLQQAKREVSG